MRLLAAVMPIWSLLVLCASERLDFLLQSKAVLQQLRSDPAWVVKSNVTDSLSATRLKQPAWLRDCSPSCYNHGGTCNMLTGQCACPVGRKTAEQGVCAPCVRRA